MKDTLTIKQKSEKVVQYSYVSRRNKAFVEKQALKANRSSSEFVDELIAANRLKRSVKFEKKILKGEAKLRQAKAKRRQKIKALSK